MLKLDQNDLRVFIRPQISILGKEMASPYKKAGGKESIFCWLSDFCQKKIQYSFHQEKSFNDHLGNRDVLLSDAGALRENHGKLLSFCKLSGSWDFVIAAQIR